MWRLSLVAVMVVGCTRREPPPQEVTVVVLAGLRGTTEPCGCTSTPQGGLDRIAARVEALRQAGPLLFVVVGDTFFEHATSPAHLYEQDGRRAETIAAVLGRLKPNAVLLGPADVAQGERMRQIAAAHELPVFGVRPTNDRRHRADSVLLTIGGMRMGLLGVPGNGAGETTSYTEGARALRAQGADVTIGLLGAAGDSALSTAKGIDGVPVLLAGGSEDPLEPRLVDAALFVAPRDKGRTLAVLKLRPVLGSKNWVYDDEGRAARHSLAVRIGELEKTLAGLEPGPARSAREQKLRGLQAELAAVAPARPADSSVTVRLESIPTTLPAAAWAKEQLATFNRSLCDIARRATENLPCAGAPSPRDAYVGNAKCATCHPDALKVWQATKHAVAWRTLENAGKECDLGCVGCHTVGYEKAGGFCRLQDASAHRDVGCEACHGPGAGHSATPFDKRAQGAFFQRGKDPTVCVGCHNKEHSDLFHFESYLAKILGPGHGLGMRIDGTRREP